MVKQSTKHHTVVSC